MTSTSFIYHAFFCQPFKKKLNASRPSELFPVSCWHYIFVIFDSYSHRPHRPFFFLPLSARIQLPFSTGTSSCFSIYLFFPYRLCSMVHFTTVALSRCTCITNTSRMPSLATCSLPYLQCTSHVLMIVFLCLLPTLHLYASMYIYILFLFFFLLRWRNT